MAAAAGGHARRQPSREQHRRAKVHVESVVQLFGREVVESSSRGQGRVRDQDVGVLNFGEEVFELVTIREVAFQHLGIVEFRSQRVERIDATPRENQTGTAIVERTSNGTAQAAAGTGKHNLRARDFHAAARHALILP